MKIDIIYGVKAINPGCGFRVLEMTDADRRRIRWETFKYNAGQVALLTLAIFSFAIALRG